MWPFLNSFQSGLKIKKKVIYINYLNFIIYKIDRIRLKNSFLRMKHMNNTIMSFCHFQLSVSRWQNETYRCTCKKKKEKGIKVSRCKPQGGEAWCYIVRDERSFVGTFICSASPTSGVWLLAQTMPLLQGEISHRLEP